MSPNYNFALLGFGLLIGILLKNYSDYAALNAYSQIVIALAALIALYQIFISLKDMKYRERSESVNLALEQINLFEEKIVIKTAQLKKLKISRNINIPRRKLKNFYADEILLGPEDVKREGMAGVSTFGVKNAPSAVATVTVQIANALERFSIPFIEAGADKEIAFYPCSRGLCEFVEENYYYYCNLREKSKVNYHNATIKLYHLWSKQLEETEELMSSNEENIAPNTLN